MSGGPSHVDLFDPKPDLIRLAGQPIPESFGTFKTRRNVSKNKLLPPLRPFRKHGQSGIEVSDLLPHIAEHVDDFCLLRGCHGDSVTHPESVYLMNTGSILMGRASLGAWTTYGLGTENQNLPAFVVLPDPGGWPKGGVTLVNLPNRHLEYAFTWFGLAGALAAIFAAFVAARLRGS